MKFFALLLLLPSISGCLRGCAGYPGDVTTSSNILILGQNGWNDNKANRGGSVRDNTLNIPWDVTLDTTNSTIYVADTQNNRILRWNSLTPAINAPANLVLGQGNFTSNKANRDTTPDADSLNMPKGVHVAGTRVAVADTGNNRVLIWTSIPTTNGQAANIELGQEDKDDDGNFFDEVLANQGEDQPDDDTLSAPTGVFIDTTNSRIIVADDGNNRVLVWNTLTPANGASANLVIGQVIPPAGGTSPFIYAFKNKDNPDNDGDGVPDPDSSSLYTPTSIFLTAAPLFFISDRDNNRILIYTVWPLVANADGSTSSVATACIGQNSFTKREADQGPGAIKTPSTNNLDGPFDVFSDGTRVWVTDTKNNRILRLSSIPTSCNEPAGTIIGQLSTSGSSPGVGPNQFNTPRGIYEVTSGGNRFLWVADSLNNRVIRISDD